MQRQPGKSVQGSEKKIAAFSVLLLDLKGGISRDH